MSVDTPRTQAIVNLWTTVVGLSMATCAYLLGYRSLAYGIIFGFILMIANYLVLSKSLRVAFGLSSLYKARFFAFFSYHIRFATLAVIMFLVITPQPLSFGVGTFIGFLVPKIIMGIQIIKETGEQWWLKTCPAEPAPRPLTPIEQELAAKSPFEFDPVEFEIQQYLAKGGK